MQKSENKLGMELAGFDPLDHFSSEQVEKMRSMKLKSNRPVKWANICVDEIFKEEVMEDFKRLNFKSKSEFFKTIYRLGVITYEAIENI